MEFRTNTGFSCNKQGRERDEKILELAELGPFKMRHLIKTLKLFPSKSTACRRLAKLCRKRRIRHVGRVYLDRIFDHPEECWISRPLKFDNREHESYLMEVLVCYFGDAKIVAGNGVDPKLRPDATMNFGDTVYHVELDTGSMSRSQVQARMKNYDGCADSVLIVCLTEPRKLRMMDWCKQLGDRGFFATIQDVIGNPYGAVWRGLDEHLYCIEKVSTPPLNTALNKP